MKTALLYIALFGAATLQAQTESISARVALPQTVVPNWHRVVPPPGWQAPAVVLERMDASVVIRDRLATTTLTFTLRNPGPRPAESVVLAPVSPAAILRSFAIEGPGGGELKAELLPRDEARRIYDEIVRRMIDPGLLEFAGSGVVRSSVFPVPPNGSTRAKLVYEEMLTGDHGRIDYALPLTESTGRALPLGFTLEWSMAGGTPTLHCPSHPATTAVSPSGAATLRFDGVPQPGSVRVSATPSAKDRPAMSLICYPPEGGEDGYFLLQLAPPDGAAAPPLPREVTLVLDRSGSMTGGKLDQARAAALQIIEGLGENERFNLIAYNEAVYPLFPEPRLRDTEAINATRSFLQALRPSGGTNIHDSLLQALKAPAAQGHLPVTLFLTDGLPTVAETSEKRIREAAVKANTGNRRVFTFGVGLDVNTPLLARLADDSRASSTFVLPGADVEMKVLSVYQSLAGPLVADPALKFLDAAGNEAHGRAIDLVPARLPDLFAGESRLVTGRWRGNDPLTLVVRGQGAKGAIESRLTLEPTAASTAHAHVPRLWATRRIAVLTEALRDLGQDGARVAPDDPRAKELIDEIVKLSTRHGVLSEFTAFLARDGQSFVPMPANSATTWSNVQARAMPMRSGAASMNQEFNSAKSKAAAVVDKSNTYFDAELKETAADGVRQVADRAFFKNNGRWTDSNVKPERQARRAAIGSPEFDALVDRLVSTNRQTLLSLPGEIIIEDAGEVWLVTGT
ncbi:MAG: VWA domain-containing protein [Verrucomicrobiales bacterium]